MKTKIFILLTIFSFLVALTAQEAKKMYIMKDGEITHEIAVSDIDSIVFYNPETINESLVFSFRRFGGFIRLDENLRISEDSTHYSISYRELNNGEPKSYQTTIKTPDEQWNYLKEIFNLETFTRISNGSCRACFDGFDETFSYAKNGETHSIYNGIADEYYQQMQDFFDSIFEMVREFEVIADFR